MFNAHTQHPRHSMTLYAKYAYNSLKPPQLISMWHGVFGHGARTCHRQTVDTTVCRATANTQRRSGRVRPKKVKGKALRENEVDGRRFFTIHWTQVTNYSEHHHETGYDRIRKTTCLRSSYIVGCHHVQPVPSGHRSCSAQPGRARAEATHFHSPNPSTTSPLPSNFAGVPGRFLESECEVTKCATIVLPVCGQDSILVINASLRH